MKHPYDNYDRATTSAEVTAAFINQPVYLIEIFDTDSDDAGNLYLVDSDGYLAAMTEDSQHPTRPSFVLHDHYGPQAAQKEAAA